MRTSVMAVPVAAVFVVVLVVAAVVAGVLVVGVVVAAVVVDVPTEVVSASCCEPLPDWLSGLPPPQATSAPHTSEDKILGAR
jgi:hypothetical protein